MGNLQTWRALLKKYRLFFITGPMSEMLDEFEGLTPVETEFVDHSFSIENVKDYQQMYFKDQSGRIITLLFHINGEIASMKSENQHIFSYVYLLSFMKWYGTELEKDFVRTLDDFMKDLHIWFVEIKEKGTTK